jgi:hypothetical protein
MRKSYYLQIGKPYYSCSMIKSSPIVTQNCVSLQPMLTKKLKKGSYITTYLTEKNNPSYSLLNTSRISLVFFAALVDPGGLPGPFLRFSGGPAGGLLYDDYCC